MAKKKAAIKAENRELYASIFNDNDALSRGIRTVCGVPFIISDFVGDLYSEDIYEDLISHFNEMPYIETHTVIEMLHHSAHVLETLAEAIEDGEPIDMRE